MRDSLQALKGSLQTCPDDESLIVTAAREKKNILSSGRTRTCRRVPARGSSGPGRPRIENRSARRVDRLSSLEESLKQVSRVSRLRDYPAKGTCSVSAAPHFASLWERSSRRHLDRTSPASF